MTNSRVASSPPMLQLVLHRAQDGAQPELVRLEHEPGRLGVGHDVIETMSKQYLQRRCPGEHAGGRSKERCADASRMLNNCRASSSATTASGSTLSKAASCARVPYVAAMKKTRWSTSGAGLLGNVSALQPLATNHGRGFATASP